MFLIHGLLICLCLVGFVNFFLSKRILSLAVSYGAFTALMILLFLKNENLNEMLGLMVSALLLFAINLLIGSKLFH